jgi:hypothetical protein
MVDAQVEDTVAVVLRRGEKVSKALVPVAPDCLAVETQAAADRRSGTCR